MLKSGKSSVLHGLAMAASAVPASLLLGYLGQAYVNGFDGLIIGLALLGGLVLSAIVITPALYAAGEESLAGYISARFGPVAGKIALLIVAIAALFVIAADLTVVSRLVSGMIGLEPQIITAAIALSAASLTIGARSRLGTGVLSTLVIVLLVCVTASVWMSAGGDLLPHLSYGRAVEGIAIYEKTMMDGGFADFRSLKAHTRAFLELDALNTIAIAVTLLAGAVLLVSPVRKTYLSSRGSRISSVISALAAMLVLMSMPALASYAKREVYAAIVKTTPLTALPVWLEAPSRADLVRIHGVSARTIDDVAHAIASDPAPDAAEIQAALQSAPHSTGTAQAFSEAKPQVKTALIEAAKAQAASPSASSWLLLQEMVLPQAAIAQNNKTGFLTHGSLAISPWAIPLLLVGLASWPGALAALLTVAVVIAAAGASRHLADAGARGLGTGETIGALLLIAAASAFALLNPNLDTLWVAFTGFSIAAAGLFPVLFAGARSRHISAKAALAAMWVGASVAASYSIATHAFPAETYELVPSFSNASDGTKKKFESLKSAWQKAADGNAKDVAWRDLETYAAGNSTRPNIALWWGVSSSAAAIFALPVALLTLLLVEAPLRISRHMRSRS